MTTDKRYIEGSIILKYDTRSALTKMKRNKPEELNTIVTEILTALESLWIDKVTEMIYNIYNNGETLEDCNRSIIIVLSKKPSANECKLYQSIWKAT